MKYALKENYIIVCVIGAVACIGDIMQSTSIYSSDVIRSFGLVRLIKIVTANLPPM